MSVSSPTPAGRRDEDDTTAEVDDTQRRSRGASWAEVRAQYAFDNAMARGPGAVASVLGTAIVTILFTALLLAQRFPTHSGPPTPDDLDELTSRRRKVRFLFAHPRAIAAFRRECNRQGLYPPEVDLGGGQVTSWRGIPLLPCNKI